MQNLSLSGKTALVTGAGQGIGKSIALKLASMGAGIAVVDINGSKASETADEIIRSGGQAISASADISKVAEIDKMIRTVAARFGTIDILVNNAGVMHTTAIEDITEEEWDRILDINLKGMFFVSQKVIPFMKTQKYGRIINISSLAGRMGGYANGVAYSASKSGAIGLTMALARRLAEFGITVNAVAPGTTESEIIKQLTPERIAMLKETIPMKKLGKPEYVADTVAFLASDSACYITGAVIDVNGGIFMG